MRIFYIFVIMLALSGCAGVAMNVKPPNLDEFPELELPFRLAGNNVVALQEIRNFLWSRGLSSIATIRAPRTFVITTYIEEPSKPDDRRIRRSAFRIGLAADELDGKAACTMVSVVSLIKSRGVREERWSTQDTDATFVSSEWPYLKAFLEKRACK